MQWSLGGSVPCSLPLFGHWWRSCSKQRYHGEAAWPGESGLMVSSQAAVESCHRNWLAVPQACALSSLLWKNASVINHLRIRNTHMPSSVKPWREQGTTPALPGETEDSTEPSRAQPGWCALGWALSACSAPGPCLGVAHKHWVSWYKTAVASLAVRIIGEKTEQNVPGSGSLAWLFGMYLGGEVSKSVHGYSVLIVCTVSASKILFI